MRKKAKRGRLDPATDLWRAGGWKRRLAAATMHEAARGLQPTAAWTGYDPRAMPQDRHQWQQTLVKAAAGAMEDAARIAVGHGADPEQPFEARWVGVSNGQMVKCVTPEPVYHWLCHGRHGEPDASIHTAIEAATAAASAPCLDALVKSSATFSVLLAWLLALPCDLRRVESGLAICDCVIARHAEGACDQSARDWLASAQEWLLYRLPPPKNASPTKGFVLNVYRRMNRHCEAFGLPGKVPNHILAEIL